jgi:protein-S-isoprenylcysteine O-methyltransferase Ste14
VGLPGDATRREDALVAAQLAALAGLGWPGRPVWALPRALGAVAAGIAAGGGALAVAGAAALGADLTPRPQPRAGATLRTTGAYRLSRHPVYAGLLAAAWGVAALRRRPEPLAAAGVLTGVLHVKAGLEERHLRARFGPAYDRYAAGTPRLLGRPRGYSGSG